MIAELLNTAIAILLVLLVAVPATLAIARTLRERRARALAAELRAQVNLQPANSDAPPRAREPGATRAAARRPSAERKSTELYRRLRDIRQNARQTKPGDRVRSRSEAPPGG